VAENNIDVVFGGGPLGLAVAETLAGRGRAVRLVTRSGRADASGGVQVVAADASDRERAVEFARGATAIYHCVGADYGHWQQLLPPVMGGVMRAAEATGARLVYGDNLYAYGPVETPLTEDHPSKAAGPNGRLRAKLAARLLDAHRVGRLRATIGRASDFYGPRVRLSTVGERVFGALLRGKPAQLLGDPDRAVAEQLYQSERPWVVDHSKFANTFGAHPTPHPEAIARTLDWYHTA
jgi:nucleoside-diphosphate-sugar epimerase